MNLDEVKKILDSHEQRIAALESNKTKLKDVKIEKEKKTLADYILELRGEGFFKDMKIPSDVHEKLKSSYPCEKNRVDVALIRLANKKDLRRATKIIDGQSYKAYVW